ncbi:MAG: hypothetical protein IKL51_09080, partial [Lachnospiraceae bacterium]|nr:hypothetical protein [Lachnospiraceae bacterium]
MALFFKREEELEVQQEDLDIIDLDQTSEWSRLDLERELLNKKEEEYIEEFSDELAIMDVTDNDISIAELEKKAEEETRLAEESQIWESKVDKISLDGKEMEEIAEEETEEEVQLQ